MSCRHRLEIEKERAAQKRDQEIVQSFVTAILRQACARHGQSYTNTLTQKHASTGQPAHAAAAQMPASSSEDQENSGTGWAQQPLELKLHMCAPGLIVTIPAIRRLPACRVVISDSCFEHAIMLSCVLADALRVHQSQLWRVGQWELMGSDGCHMHAMCGTGSCDWWACSVLPVMAIKCIQWKQRSTPMVPLHLAEPAGLRSFARIHRITA